MSNKPNLIKDYDKLPKDIIEQVKLFYPNGYDRKVIMFKNHKKKLVSALPFEAEDFHYLIKMTQYQAQEIVKSDDDFDHNGQLKVKVVTKLTKKYAKEPPVEETDSK